MTNVEERKNMKNWKHSEKLPKTKKVFILILKQREFDWKQKDSIFSLKFRQFCRDMDNGEKMRKMENWALEIKWKATQKDPLNNRNS